MKTKLMAAAALCCMMTAFTACTTDDNPVIPVSGRAMITVNTAALYEELDLADRMPSYLDDGTVTIIDSVLIYDQTGNLLTKVGAKTRSLQPLTIDADDLPNGTYTLVAWQSACDADEKVAWSIAGENQLSTVNLYTKYERISWPWAVGYASATVTVDGGSVEASLTPKSLGSIIDIRIDNLTEDMGYTRVILVGSNSQYVIGCNLDPSLPEEDRWIMEREHNWTETVGNFPLGRTSQKYFTLTHGVEVDYHVYGVKEDGKTEWLTDGYYDLGTGEATVFYFDMNRRQWQPPFFGTPEDFAPWKADRDAGILVADPYLDWGCSIDDVDQHIKAKRWWYDGNDKLEFWEGWGLWHKWYYVANLLTEQYLFETEDGKNLTVILSICHDSSVPLEVAHNSLLKQGYVYNGKIVFPGYDPRDIFFSADGKTEVQLIPYGDGRWELFYQPTDPDDFQYIIPAEE